MNRVSHTRFSPWRLLRRLFKPLPLEHRRSGWKLWATQLVEKPFLRLKRLESQLMIGMPSKPENVLLMDVINQWSFYNPDAKIQTPTLLLHGYATSSMCYHRNMPQLSEGIKHLYTIDLPANGLSKELPLELDIAKPIVFKPEFNSVKSEFHIPYTIDGLHHRCAIQKLEDYYIDSIELWRRKNSLGAINLVGHSFGGYISFKYSIKYPQNVKKLCLISPIGVERNIYSVHNNWRSNCPYSIDYEDPSSKHFANKTMIPEFVFNEQTKLLRLMGPLGAKLGWKYINAVYSKVPNFLYLEFIFTLIYGKNVMTDTSRNIFTYLFTNSLLARDPMLDSLEHLHVDKLLMLYGEHDWVRSQPGKMMVEEFNKQRSHPSGTLTVVPDASHNLFLDNPVFFNVALLNFLKE
ncbi:lysophosphatidic acid acyltransferase ICT1 Ecym_4285 [Eremothecium cymbalariae DBVPG|uniref:AB hydrolase-1 domain-containing protein n=1 Tax=Eremothecium cymbalariae (strain CBS 270.75 / DBVPG 7215 / KCTC 17166 / NRRL Y-17582) TaxID=931890 RepID=G8JTJ5_ERECY|nr:hypothetical protein Ecym_4285 [Eremothecium cymbalariae DBVPG\